MCLYLCWVLSDHWILRVCLLCFGKFFESYCVSGIGFCLFWFRWSGFAFEFFFFFFWVEYGKSSMSVWNYLLYCLCNVIMLLSTRVPSIVKLVGELWKGLFVRRYIMKKWKNFYGRVFCFQGFCRWIKWYIVWTIF